MKVDRGSRIRIRNDTNAMIAQIAARWIAMNDAMTASFILGGTFLLLLLIVSFARRGKTKRSATGN
jgi:hypothetical protein